MSFKYKIHLLDGDDMFYVTTKKQIRNLGMVSKLKDWAINKIFKHSVVLRNDEVARSVQAQDAYVNERFAWVENVLNCDVYCYTYAKRSDDSTKDSRYYEHYYRFKFIRKENAVAFALVWSGQ